MTPKEFKEAHPEFAHLQGLDLWNAMEDSMIPQPAWNSKKRTLEDVLEDVENNPADWTIVKRDIPDLGSVTFHFKNDFLGQFNNSLVPDRPMSMCMMVPGLGLLDVNGNAVQATAWYRPGFWSKFGKMRKRSREYFRMKAYYASHPFAKRGDYGNREKNFEIKYVDPQDMVPAVEFWAPKSRK